jgi:hypothetical protein
MNDKQRRAMFAKNSPNSSNYPDFTKNKQSTNDNFELLVDWFDARNDGLNDKSTQAKIQHLRNKINEKDLSYSNRLFVNAYDKSPTKLTSEQKQRRIGLMVWNDAGTKFRSIKSTTGYDY